MFASSNLRNCDIWHNSHIYAVAFRAFINWNLNKTDSLKMVIQDNSIMYVLWKCKCLCLFLPVPQSHPNCYFYSTHDNHAEKMGTQLLTTKNAMLYKCCFIALKKRENNWVPFLFLLLDQSLGRGQAEQHCELGASCLYFEIPISA